jgi:hypothetical protein
MDGTQRSPSQFSGLLLPPDFFEMTMDPSTIITSDISKQSVELTPTPATDTMQKTVYQTPPRNAVSIAKTPAAPKRQPRKRKTTNIAPGMQRYALWSQDSLQIEFMRRFSPLSQKRLNDRNFMIFWLNADDEEQEQHDDANVGLVKNSDGELRAPKIPICIRCMRLKSACVCKIN